MNTLTNTIVNEYKRLSELERALVQVRDSLPAGYISVKTINGKKYHYLQYREGKKVKSRYIKKEELKETSEGVAKRKAVEAELSEVRKQKKSLEGVVDKDTIMIMTIQKAVQKVVGEFPEIKKVVLFGSRAESRYRDDSDVDLMFESHGPVSLIRQNEFRMKLEDELGLEVDLVHGPVEESFLNVGREIDIYAA